MNPFNRTFSLQYDPDGKNTVVTYSNGEQEQRGYTPRDWLSSLTVSPPGAAVDTFSYLYTDTLGHYDPTGHLRQEVNAGSRAHVFSYDNLYQLVQETHPDFGTIGYGYDLNGNRTSKTTSGGTDYYGVDAANKLLWVNRGTNAAPTSGQVNPYTLFGYDLNGNVTSRERRDDSGLLRSYSFSWDGDNRLRSVNEGATNRFTATYDGSGTRISKTDSWTGAHNYSWGPDGLVYDSAGSTIYTPGLSQQVGGVDRYPLHDWLGSTRYLTDGSQGVTSALRFDAFGNRSLTGGTDPYDPSDFQFAGSWGYQAEYASATEPGLGLQYLDQRYYDPAVGRFISQDPIGLAGGLNPYAYADNDPVNAVDPSGLDWDPIVDVVAIGLDAETLREDLGNPCASGATIFWDRIFLGADTAAALLPFIPPVAGAALRAEREALALEHGAEALLRAQELAVATRGPRFGFEAGRFGERLVDDVRFAEGPYDDLKEPRNVGSGRDFTPAQHRRNRAANRARNGGVLRDDVTGELASEPQQGRAGVTPDPNEAHGDHFIPKSKGGTNSNRNYLLRLRKYNLAKSNKMPEGG